MHTVFIHSYKITYYNTILRLHICCVLLCAVGEKSNEGGFAEVLSEKTPLLSWTARKPKPTPQIIRVRIRSRAPGDSDFTDISDTPQYVNNPFHSEPGMEYQVQFLLDGKVQGEVVLATPKDSSE